MVLQQINLAKKTIGPAIATNSIMSIERVGLVG
jgi:hypothetical protein